MPEDFYPPVPVPSSLPRPDIKISEKYRNIVPPMSQAEYESLRDDIKRQGLHVPLLVNEKSVLLDGHHRLRACDELGIKPHVEVHAPFESELEEEIFVYKINLERRHINLAQRVNLVLEMQPKLAELARRNMSKGGKGSRIQETLHVDKELATIAKSSKDTIHKMRQVKQAAQTTPDKRLEFDYDGRYRGKAGPTYAQLFKDTLADKLTPSKAYNTLKRVENINAKRAEAKAAVTTLKLPDKITLLNMDSTAEDIPEIADNSVDLIVTDPPYMKEYLHVFEALAKFAVRKLKPGGSLVFYYSTYFEPDIHAMFAKYKDQLTWWWRLHVDHEGARTPIIHERHVRVRGKPMMWFVKGDRRLTGTFVVDSIQSTKPDKSTHAWAQSSTEAEYLIQLLTISEDAIVVDPFLGGGAFAVAADRLDRYFIGIELDKDIFERAKNYIASEVSKSKSK